MLWSEGIRQAGSLPPPTPSSSGPPCSTFRPPAAPPGPTTSIPVLGLSANELHHAAQGDHCRQRQAAWGSGCEAQRHPRVTDASHPGHQACVPVTGVRGEPTVKGVGDEGGSRTSDHLPGGLEEKGSVRRRRKEVSGGASDRHMGCDKPLFTPAPSSSSFSPP